MASRHFPLQESGLLCLVGPLFGRRMPGRLRPVRWYGDVGAMSGGREISGRDKTVGRRRRRMGRKCTWNRCLPKHLRWGIGNVVRPINAGHGFGGRVERMHPEDAGHAKDTDRRQPSRLKDRFQPRLGRALIKHCKLLRHQLTLRRDALFVCTASMATGRQHSAFPLIDRMDSQKTKGGRKI
jgi:hypothetical protein